MMTFRVLLKKARKLNESRLMFDLKKLRVSDAACTFQETIDGKFSPLIGLRNENMGITTYYTAVTDVGSEMLGKERRRKNPCVTRDVSTSVIRGEI